jgi:hypothetical protein
MLSFKLLVPTLLFTALILAAALQGLSASGHFPRTAKGAASVPGPIVLFGSLALAIVGFVAGAAAALRLAPWYAAVIGGGLAVLVAPLVLQVFPDRFVDGRGALIAFGGASAGFAILLIALAIGW